MVIGLLEKEGYEWQEFHLSPSQFNIPNQRMRYYLLVCIYIFSYEFLFHLFIFLVQAKKQPNKFLNASKELLKEIPESIYFSNESPKAQPLEFYLDEMTNEQLLSFMVPEKTVLASGMLFGIFHCCYYYF